MNNLTIRTISGIIFIAILISSILFSPYTFAVVFAIITALSVHEFHQLTNKKPEISVGYLPAIVGGVMLFLASFLQASAQNTFHAYSIYGIYVALVLIYELYRKKQNPINNWAYFVLGQVYTALPFSLLNFIAFHTGEYKALMLLAVFVFIWANDTGAYVSGMMLGRHKLFERISPKKTWEGFIGGALFVLVAGFFVEKYFNELTLVQWFIFAEIIVIFGTLGDLCESMIKRTLNVKDSGDMIPGHGGILDRFDSMIMAAPVIYFYLNFIS